MGQTNNGPLALVLLVASLLVFLAMSAVSVAEGESLTEPLVEENTTFDINKVKS